MSQPLVILIPGSFAYPALYSSFTNAVKQKGQDVEALHLPSTGIGPGQGRDGLPTMYDDAEFIATEVEKHADQGRDIILLPHSYAGIPTTQCLKGISKQEREKNGKKGGVVEIAYMTCLVPGEGGTAMSVLAELPEDNQTKPDIDEKGWMANADHARVAKIIAQTMPEEDAIGFIKQMPKHSSASFATPLTYEGFKDVPISYLLAEEDHCIFPSIQKAGIDMIEQKSGRKVDVTPLPVDHCPPQSAESMTVDWILGVVKKVQERA